MKSEKKVSKKKRMRRAMEWVWGRGGEGINCRARLEGMRRDGDRGRRYAERRGEEKGMSHGATSGYVH